MRKLLPAFVLALLAACAPKPQLAPLSPDAVILAFGDSLTYGTGAAPEESYPAVLGRLVSRTVINAGVPGEVTAEGLARLPELLERHRPALLILCHGGNDLLRRVGEKETADNIRAMVRMARERGAGVLLIGVPTPGLFPSPPGFYREIAREFGLPYEGEVLRRIEKERSLKADYIHPNGAGYRMLAGAVADLLRRSGAI